MSRFIKSISLFLAGLSAIPFNKADAVAADSSDLKRTNEPGAVTLRPLNREMDNLFAGHRSHSSHSSHRSHASHASHYSGSGGGYAPAPSAPSAPSPPATPNIQPAPAAPLVAPSPGAVPSSPAAVPAGGLTTSEKLELQVLRVQIRLARLGLYEGAFSGVFSPATKSALKRFQKLNQIPETGLMTTPTLNALGIPAVN